jgi:diguanylate cyclase (GGDEF)-like protein
MTSLQIPGIVLDDEIYRLESKKVYSARSGSHRLAVNVWEGPESEFDGIIAAVAKAATTRIEGLGRILSIGTTDDAVYWIREYIDGETLSLKLQRETFSEPALLQLATRLARVLSAIHERGIIHRGLQSTNIVMDASGHAWLLDLGVFTPSSSVKGTENPKHFREAVQYQAPEMAGMLQCPVDHRSDLYSLGVVLYHAASGQLPFESENLSDLVRMHASGSAQPIRELNAGMSLGFAQMINTLLSKDPEERYQSAGAFLADLQRLDDINSVLLDVGEREESSLGGGVLCRKHQSWGRPNDFLFVGRDLELTRLACSWQNATEGKGAVVVIEGDEGAGKTRVVDEFITREVDAEAALVLRGSAGVGGYVPYGTLSRALRRFVDDLRLRPAALQPKLRFRIKKALGETMDVLAGLAPNSIAFFGLTGAASMHREGDERGEAAYCERVVECLFRLGSVFPSTVITIDDAHRLEGSSQRVVTMLAARLGGARMLIVLTRVADAATGGQTLFSGGMAGKVERVLLAPLELEAAEEIMSHELGGETIDPRFVSHLQRATRGNAFALSRYMRMALGRGAIWPEGGVWYPRKNATRRLTGEADLQGLVDWELNQLQPGNLRTLGAAALLGRPFRAEEVLAMTDGRPASFSAAVEEGQRLGLLTQIAVDRWEMDRHRVLANLRSRLDAATRASFHGRAAHWVEGMPGSQSFERARHIALSDWPLDDTGRYKAVNQAGRTAVEQGDDSVAFLYLEEARRISEARGIRLTSDVHKSLAQLSERAGQFEAAIEHLVSAVDNAETTVERAKLFGQIATNALLGRGDPTMALGMAVQALKLCGYSDLRGGELDCTADIDVLKGLTHLEPSDIKETLSSAKGRAFVLEAAETCLVAAYLRGASGRSFGVVAKILKTLVTVESSSTRTSAFLLLAFADTLMGSPSRAVRHLKEAKAGCPTGEFAARYEGLKAFARFRFEEDDELDSSLFVQRPKTPLGLLLTLEMAHVFWLRGHSETAHAMLSLVERLPNSIGGEVARPALWNAVELLHGRDVKTPEAFTEDEIQAVSSSPSDYLRASSRSAAVIMELERGETVSRLDLLCSQREAMGTSIGAHCLQLSDYRVYAGYVRLAQAMSQELRGQVVGLEALRKAVKSIALCKPRALFFAHEKVLAAGLARLEGKFEKAVKLLDVSEKDARLRDNRWVRFEVARLNACLLLDQGKSEAAQTEAYWAYQLAQRFGWTTRSQRVQREFDLVIRHEHASGTHPPEQDTATRYRQHLDALLEVGLASSMLLEPAEQARVALDEIIRVFAAQRAFLFVYDDDEGALRLNTGRNVRGETVSQVAGYKGRAVQQVWNSLEPVVIRGCDNEEDGTGIMAAPLIARDRLLGVVYVDGSRSQSNRHSEDVQVLLAIANHLAVTLETSRVNQLEVEFASERRERRLAENLRTVATSLSTTLELSEVLARLLESLGQLIAYDRALVLMRREDRFEVAAARGKDGEIRTLPSYGVDEYAVLAELVETKRPICLDDLPKELRSSHPLGDAPSTSWMGVPLLRGMEVTGVLILTDDRRGAYTGYDSEIAFTFASQAAIALENARLFGEVERLAVIDELTGVYNRRAFFDLSQREFQRASRYQNPLAAIMVDLDNFKIINDTLGHSAGDEVLTTIATRLQNAVRELDILGRYGGEEFVILAPQTGLAEACTVAERLRAIVTQEPVAGPSGDIDVTASFGVAAMTGGEGSLSALLDRADKALYQAKSEGKNCVRRFR